MKVSKITHHEAWQINTREDFDTLHDLHGIVTIQINEDTGVRNNILGWVKGATLAGFALQVPPGSWVVRDAEHSVLHVYSDEDFRQQFEVDEKHVMTVEPGGWFLKHPLTCRPDLAACETNVWLRKHFDQTGTEGFLSAYGPGKYDIELVDVEGGLDSKGITVNAHAE